MAPTGRPAPERLVATADVLVENYRPGAFEALGLGYDDMRKINPKLIYASFSAFGQDGPRGRQTAYDHVIQATSGLMAMTGTKDVHPVKLGSPAVDYATGMTGAFALASALFQRERTGRGQRADRQAAFPPQHPQLGTERTRFSHGRQSRGSAPALQGKMTVGRSCASRQHGGGGTRCSPRVRCPAANGG